MNRYEAFKKERLDIPLSDRSIAFLLSVSTGINFLGDKFEV